MENLRGWLLHPITVRVSQLIIGVVFIVAGLAKLGDLRSFADQIHNFRMIPIPLEHLLAMTLPWIELVAGMALMLGLHSRAGGYLTAGMMVIFTLAVAQAVLRGLDIECGCFGTADATKVGLVKLLENGALLVVAVVASLRPKNP